MATRPVKTSDILNGHVSLDIECLDRVYLNGYVPNLQVGGQVVQFLARRGFPIPSPAVVNRIGERFRESVRRFAQSNGIPVVKFGKGDRKIDVMRPHLARQAATGRSGVAAIGTAQEFQRVATCSVREARNGGAPHFGWDRAERRVSCFYFYLWDADFGPAFIKICAYFPYPIKVWLNGHEWAKQQATQAGIGFTALANGFASTTDPAGLQAICDRLGPGHDRGVLRTVDGPAAAAADAGGPGEQLLVGAVHAPDRGVAHAGVRRTAQRAGVLRGPGRGQPRPR